MKGATLIALLPLLATISARPQPGPSSRSHLAQQKKDVRVSRKSIAFGPELTHSTFRAFHQVDLKDHPLNVGENIVGLARGDVFPVVKHLMSTLDGIKGEGEGYFIRDDSYTDERTGISHIFIKQIVNGLEVVNGDINMNIDQSGRVISWGNSFYQGPHPTHSSEQDDFISALISAQPVPTAQCDKLSDLISTTSTTRDLLLSRLSELKRGPQVGGIVKSVFSMIGELIGLPVSRPVTDLERGLILEHLKEEYGFDSIDTLEMQLERLDGQMERLQDHVGIICSAASSNQDGSKGFKNGDLGESLLPGLIGLLQHLAPPSISFSPSDLVSQLTVHPASSILPCVQAPSEPGMQLIHGAASAGVTDPVQARLVYTQTDGEGLRLTWKYTLRMGADNWYDATVDVEDGRVLSVVDWASSIDPIKVKKNKGGKQKPLPVPKPATKPYSYSVFPFGVNDPSVGNMSTETSPWDRIASPAGWHAFPDASNPWTRQTVKGMKTGQKGPFVGNHSLEADVELEVEDGKGKGESWSTFGTTMGNNVFAQEDFEGANNWLHNDRPVNSSFIFDYEYGEPDGLRPKEYIDLAVTQLFYTSNMYHDLLHRLGFDEVSGNFQMYNFGKGGLGGDGVICQAQDGSGTNNANFMTPPDGTQPRMRMYVWDTATPYRDGDLEAGIVIHEYTHGLSTRLTGGPANSGCLGYGEAGGMGEGWGDAFATLIRQVEEYGTHPEEYGMGAWAANRKTGIRNYVYSTNTSSNPSSFKTLDKPGYWGVHAIGEVWAEMLFVVEQRLIEVHGFGPTLFPPISPEPASNTSYYLPPRNLTTDGPSQVGGGAKPSTPLVPRYGNTLLAHLIVQGMKLQPCRPSFTDARDAILQSDLILTGGENACTIWKGFAERGLGPEAKTLGQLPWGGGVRSEDYSIPKICGKVKVGGK